MLKLPIAFSTSLEIPVKSFFVLPSHVKDGQSRGMGMVTYKNAKQAAGQSWPPLDASCNSFA